MKVSVVVPVYYNEQSLGPLHQRLASVAASLAPAEFEFVFVDDGSGDNSFEVLKALAAQDARVKVIRLVRNFGSNPAILAGLTFAQGDCVIELTADLQDPPELIPQMVSHWQAGTKLVLATRAGRNDPLITRFSGGLFNRLFKWLVFPNFPAEGFDFFLADREVIQILIKIAGPNLYLFGLLLWTGYPPAIVSYIREERRFGKSRWTFSKKFKYFLDAFIGFSYLPLRLASIVGILLAVLGFLYAVFILAAKVVAGFPIEGWTSLMVVLLLVTGTQLLMLGILGEYQWRNLDESRRRPSFLIDQVVGGESKTAYTN